MGGRLAQFAARSAMETLLSYLAPAAPEEPAVLVATVEDVLKDLQEMETQGLTLRDRIREFPETGGSLMTALGIHNDTVQLQSLVDKTAGDVKIVPLPIAFEDGTKTIDAINRLKPLLNETMKLIVEKKASFEQLSIGIPSIIKFDLTTLHDSVVILEDALITASPPELSDTARTIKTEIEAIFDEVIAAYS